jgi:hypothetical protein
MFQTLVEDIDSGDDPYSYSSRLDGWVDEKTEWVPAPLKAVGRTLLMTHDTTLYKVLNQATMFSDFTSRQVLQKHLTTKRKPLDTEEALRQTRAAFVNYDLPTHWAVQYMNDMGLLFFTKYYLRIQAVIFQLVKDNPLRALSVMYGFDHIWSLSDIFDSSMIGKTPGTFGMGALELPGAIDEMVTWRALGL